MKGIKWQQDLKQKKSINSKSLREDAWQRKRKGEKDHKTSQKLRYLKELTDKDI